MWDLLKLIQTALIGRFRSSSFEVENLALRHQLNVLRRKSRKPDVLTIMEPESVVRWHRAGFSAVLALEVAITTWQASGSS